MPCQPALSTAFLKPCTVLVSSRPNHNFAIVAFNAASAFPFPNTMSIGLVNIFPSIQPVRSEPYSITWSAHERTSACPKGVPSPAITASISPCSFSVSPNSGIINLAVPLAMRGDDATVACTPTAGNVPATIAARLRACLLVALPIALRSFFCTNLETTFFVPVYNPPDKRNSPTNGTDSPTIAPTSAA